MEILLEIFIAFAAPFVIYTCYVIISGRYKFPEIQAMAAEKKKRDTIMKREERKKRWRKIFDNIWSETYGQFFDHSN